MSVWSNQDLPLDLSLSPMEEDWTLEQNRGSISKGENCCWVAHSICTIPALLTSRVELMAFSLPLLHSSNI